MFRGIFIIIGIVLIVGIAYLLLIRPSHRHKEAAKKFAQYRFAHRGLHDADIVENTLGAFENAKDAGYGIELDVRLTADKEVVVFHDDSLLRVAGRNETIARLSSDEVSAVNLFGTDAHVPLFSDVVSILKDTPLLVELKSDTSDVAELASKTATLLDTYHGPYAIESFNPFILSWFKANRPQVLRGQLVMRKELPKSQPAPVRFILAHMLFNGIVKPDFLACRISETDVLTFRLCRLLYHPVLFGWTVKSEDDVKIADGMFDTIIFENIRP